MRVSQYEHLMELSNGLVSKLRSHAAQYNKISPPPAKATVFLGISTGPPHSRSTSLEDFGAGKELMYIVPVLDSLLRSSCLGHVRASWCIIGVILSSASHPSHPAFYYPTELNVH